MAGFVAVELWYQRYHFSQILFCDYVKLNNPPAFLALDYILFCAK